MKDLADLTQDIRRRMSRTWADDVIAGPRAGNWPHSLSLGAPQGAELDHADQLFVWARDWHAWIGQMRADSGVELRVSTRVYRGTRQTVPTHVTVPTLDAAAQLVGGDWPERLRTATARLKGVHETCPNADIDPATLRVLERYSDADFALLLTAANWFARHPSSGLTPRQVPIAGLHSKWLNSAGRRDLVCRFAGLEHLGLDERRPHPVNFTYLDPAYRRGTGRIHDSIVPGDRAVLAYPPALVLICENRDSAVFFPDVPAAIAIQGAGREGPARLQELLEASWLPAAARIVYWGDLDASGLEIVDDYRARGVAVDTMLMDLDALRTYAIYGVSTAPSGEPLSRSRRRTLTHLTEGESAAYAAVTSPNGLPARVEQERIPLQDALRALNLS